MKNTSPIVVKKGQMAPRVKQCSEKEGNVVVRWVRDNRRKLLRILALIVLLMVMPVFELIVYVILKSEAIEIQSALAFAHATAMSGADNVWVDFGRDDDGCWYCVKSEIDDAYITNRLSGGIEFLKDGQKFEPAKLMFVQGGKTKPEGWETDLGYLVKYRRAYTIRSSGSSGFVMERKKK